MASVLNDLAKSDERECQASRHLRSDCRGPAALYLLKDIGFGDKAESPRLVGKLYGSVVMHLPASARGLDVTIFFGGDRGGIARSTLGQRKC